MEKDVTVIRVRRGINGHKYSACDAEGNFISNFDRLADVRKHWQREIRWGKVVLVRELGQTPDMSATNDTIKLIDAYLRTFVKK